MNQHSHQGWNLRSSYKTLPNIFYTLVAPTPVNAPKLVIFNHELAKSLGLEFSNSDEESLALLFSGNTILSGTTPLAQAYAGHQFGHFTMLGDGRAHLLGEQLTPEGKLFDIQLKGSGVTPYSRRGDGRAALAPMLREYLISEAMHALGIPSTRSLAVVSTGEMVVRDTLLKGAILTRVASSHIRVGTFEYAFAHDIKALTDYTIYRHYPELIHHERPYISFLNAVIERQAKLVASWMLVGFVHGVMNTDNMTISGETIDYGPCAFIDNFMVNKVFSSIDHSGRYAFGNQPPIAQWNLARLAESLISLLSEDERDAIEIAKASVNKYSALFKDSWLLGMRTKLGLISEDVGDISLIQSLLEWMQKTGADYTNTFRDLTASTISEKEIYKSQDFQVWYSNWQARLKKNPEPLEASINSMRASNPVVIPRNQHVEDALNAATNCDDLNPFYALLKAVMNPFIENESNSYYRNPPPHSLENYQTFCGT